MESGRTASKSVFIATDEAAIRHIFDQLADAWNAGDASKFGSFFTDDCDYVTFAGQHIKGRQQNEQIHHDLFNAWALKGSTMHTGPGLATITFLSPTIALTHSTGTIQLRFQKKPPPDRLSIQTMVLVKTNGYWKIRAFHNCRVQQPDFLQRLLMSFSKK
ncbi:SgcJ/EcaC family oxidoreductase [Spirosoma sp. SC4-14]|uniref:SgcJ/EcaC family oxidoreductase n=1 Tax=Spirosoma sp. SC4-14 TaxID=3128900 RepID=UPI0030D1E51A